MTTRHGAPPKGITCGTDGCPAEFAAKDTLVAQTADTVTVECPLCMTRITYAL